MPILLLLKAIVSAPSVDASQLATKAEVANAITAATPNPCTVPLGDTLNGSVAQLQ